MILIALGFAFNIHYTIFSVFATIAMVFLITISVVSIGLAIGAFMSSPEGFGLVSSFVIFPIFFLSGALFPVSHLPGWLSFFVSLNPMTYGVDALRGIILGISTFGIMNDIAVIVAFDAVMAIIGTWAFKRMEM